MMIGSVLGAGSTKSLMVRILGPVDLVVDNVRVPVGGRHERMVLGALAISANHAVSLDQLAQILWEDTPPPSRDNTLQTYVSRLKQRLGAGRILTEDHCYELRIEEDELDALVFEKVLNEAARSRNDTRRCLDRCKSALSFWRGPPFGDFADQDPFRLESIRLNELRLHAMELQMECLLKLGRLEVVVGTLETLVDEHPYRERMWFLLMSALALDGRRVEALRASENLRKILEEAGLRPSSEIRQLEERILMEEPALTASLHLLESED